MTNPIQIVLDAETRAQQQIEDETREAQTRIREAQQRARQIVDRNEQRTGNVAKRYEALCQRDLSRKIDIMLDEAGKDLEQFTHLSITDRDGIIDAVCLSLSPNTAPVRIPDD